MQSKASEMLKKKDKLAVSLHRYNKLRSRLPDAEIAIVEGAEDSIFYSAIFVRQNLDSPEIFFQANGKDNVLGLRKVFSKSKEITLGKGNLFFVDADFDGLKGAQPGFDIYVTPTYSIENILVSKEALRRLMNAEFGLGTSDLIGDQETIISLFDDFLAQHASELKEANRLLHCVRKEALAGNTMTSGSIDENPEKFASVNANDLKIVKRASGENLHTLLKIKHEIRNEDTKRHEEDFLKLNPDAAWRGKFLFYLFKKFLSILIEDRNSSKPRFFSSGKGKISLDTNQGSLIRILASLCSIPACLANFIEGVREGKHRPAN